MLRFPNRLMLGCLVLTALVCAPTAADAQLLYMDGTTLPTFVVPLDTPAPAFGPPTPFAWAMPLLEDGWTVDARYVDIGFPSGDWERETYLFPLFGTDVVFVEKVKLSPQLLEDTTVQVAEDIFILPSKPKCSTNPNGENLPPIPPMIWIDDVVFPPVTLIGFEGPKEFLLVVYVPADKISSFFDPSGGTDVQLDWFSIADMDVRGSFYGQPPAPDLDGNTFPDVCIEPGFPGLLVPRIGLDEKGAALLNWLINGALHALTTIDVFEPQTQSFFPPTNATNPYFPGLPPLLPGMAMGESKNTRPWCFTMSASAP
jgi:hypothetical protein